MKYILWDDIQFIIFPESLEHSVACPVHKDKVTSAGFCNVVCGHSLFSVEVKAYGDSRSLGIESRPELDSRIMTSALNR